MGREQSTIRAVPRGPSAHRMLISEALKFLASQLTTISSFILKGGQSITRRGFLGFLALVEKGLREKESCPSVQELKRLSLIFLLKAESWEWSVESRTSSQRRTLK